MSLASFESSDLLAPQVRVLGGDGPNDLQASGCDGTDTADGRDGTDARDAETEHRCESDPPPLARG